MKMINNLKGARPPKVITDLRHLVVSGAECFGEKSLYIYRDVNGEEAQYSYIRLKEEVEYIGTAFYKLGISNKAVAVSGDTHPRYIATYISVVAGNGCIVPIDRDISVEATVDFLRLAECEAFVYTKAQAQKAVQIAELMPEIKYFIPLEPDGDSIFSDKVISIDDIIEMGKTALLEGCVDYINTELEMEKCPHFSSLREQRAQARALCSHTKILPRQPTRRSFQCLTTTETPSFLFFPLTIPMS